MGDLFARGVLRPFQDYGTIRQYAPLVYLIPGQIEAWFGASLKTGRFFSVFCGLMLVIAVWICANRLGGKWLGAAVVWGMALTPISIQIYSLAISEALVACLLAWALMLVLGEGKTLVNSIMMEYNIECGWITNKSFACGNSQNYPDIVNLFSNMGAEILFSIKQ